MGGSVEGRNGIPSTFSSRQSPNLEKTQAELRHIFTAAEKFRRELEFLQKGGDPLDLKTGNAALGSIQSTSLIDQQHLEQFVTSEAKSSFAVNISPHEDSVGSSGRLGGLSVCEPNSADNLVLFSGGNKFQELVKRPICPPTSNISLNQIKREPDDSAAFEIPKKSYKRRVRSRIKKRDGGRSSSSDAACLEPESLEAVSTKGLDSGSSCTQIGQSQSQSLDVHNENELPASPRNINCNGITKQVLASSEVSVKEDANLGKEKEGKMLKITNNDNNCRGTHTTIIVKEEEGLKESESATKENDESILKEARIIEAKRKRIAELSATPLPLQNHPTSHWDFVLEEMAWLANDFAQERLWKVTAAAQISRRVAFASRVRYQQQSSLWKQKEVAQTLGRVVMEFWNTIKCLKTDSKKGLRGYAVRFLEYNSIHSLNSAAHVPVTPDILSDMSIIDNSWEDNLAEETLVYMVPPGATEAYRKSIESHLLQSEGTWSGMQEEVGTSGYDAVTENAYEEDDETYFPGASEGIRSSKSTKKRRKNFKFNAARSYETGADIETQPLNVPIPNKHLRTPSRQRVLGPFSGGTGYIQTLNGTEASSGGDTNYFQDEKSNMEAESVGAACEKTLKLEAVEMLDRPRKRMKDKHMGSSFDHRWELDSQFQNDQKDHSKRRLDAHQLDSNGSNVTSQMSNMSNPKKFMELIARDRSKKPRTNKIPAGHPDSVAPWSLFEDQFLVVLVHDMGPNWELISDAINSNMQFKFPFRNSKECKERHKILMDKNNGDGGDSGAEDSGSSQSYPSTLPGIPEGSARQLFQRLKGPMEENTIKSHFENIIKIGQKQYSKAQKNKKQDVKPLLPPHASHTLSLSQVSPNNLNGGPVLTPLELCVEVAPTPDVVSVGHQGSHGDQVNGGTMPPGASLSSSVPAGSSMVHGNDFSPASVREGRFGMPRNGSLSKDQQKSLLYKRMLSARNLQNSSSGSHHSAAERGACMLPNVMPQPNRNMTMGKPGFHGVSGSPAGSLVSSGQGKSNLRPPLNSLHLMRANQNSDRIQPAEFPMRQLPFSNRNQLSGPPANPAFRMQLHKDRQIQQQRVLQQHIATSNSVMPPVQQLQKSQLPVSAPQNGIHGIMRNPILNQQQQTKFIKPENLPDDSSLPNVAQSETRDQQQRAPHHLLKSGQRNLLYSKLNPIKPSHSPDHINNNDISNSNHHQKMVNLCQATTSGQRRVNNGLVSSSEPPPSTNKPVGPPPVNPTMVVHTSLAR